MARRASNKLEIWEVEIVKAMLKRKFVPQDIQAYFTRPTRSINHARISEIRDGFSHNDVNVATDEELDDFLANWPNIDPKSGLNLTGDELLIKSREAMIASVNIFNSCGLLFRSEIFITTAIISWVYLLHHYYKTNGIEYIYKKSGNSETTENGAERYWDLSQCLDSGNCPLERDLYTCLTQSGDWGNVLPSKEGRNDCRDRQPL